VVHSDTTVDQLVDNMLGRNARGFAVVDHGALVGIVTLTDIKDTPRERWSSLRIADIMTPRHKLITATPTTELDDVLQQMSLRDIHQVPVLENGALVGMLTRSAVIRFLQLRQELNPGSDGQAAARIPR
jgi:CBS domain-containing protein